MAFAPGKVILLGEHAVVYGVPALAGALGDGVTVETRPGDGALEVPQWGTVVRPGDTGSSLALAYAALRNALAARFDLPDVDLVARFGVPAGAGLGSSAALSVAIARALSETAGARLDAEAECAVANAAETVFHGKPSGIDAAVAAHGGFGVYARAAGFRALPTDAAVPLVIGHTGRPRDTKGRVARVAEIHAEREGEARACFGRIEDLVRRAIDALAIGDHAALGGAMNENQRDLEALEVSCEEIERMCALSREAGALGAKLTGGGGGGCVIALAPGREAAIRDAWARAGFDSFITRVGGPALRSIEARA